MELIVDETALKISRIAAIEDAVEHSKAMTEFVNIADLPKEAAASHRELLKKAAEIGDDDHSKYIDTAKDKLFQLGELIGADKVELQIPDPQSRRKNIVIAIAGKTLTIAMHDGLQGNGLMGFKIE